MMACQGVASCQGLIRCNMNYHSSCGACLLLLGVVSTVNIVTAVQVAVSVSIAGRQHYSVV